jgi:hypothetical protein
MAHQTRHGGTWRPTTQPSIRHGGAWRDASAAWIRQGGTWLKWWPDLPDRGGPYLYGSISSCGPNICRFDGSLWVSVGGGRNALVTAAQVNNAGHICALGNFTSPSDLAIWDGSTWSQPSGLPSGLSKSSRPTILNSQFFAHFSDGLNIYMRFVGGIYSHVLYLLDSPPGFGSIYTSAIFDDTYGGFDIYAVGLFDGGDTIYESPLGGSSNIAVSGYIPYVQRQLNGKAVLIVSGVTSYIYQDGGGDNSWTRIGTATGFTPGGPSDIVALPDGRIFTAGSFTSVDGISANGLAWWNGTAWAQIGPGLSNSVGLSYHQGKLWILAGTSRTTRKVYTWDGTTLALHSDWTGDDVYGIL